VATRFSPGYISLGTPMRMVVLQIIVKSWDWWLAAPIDA